MNKTRAATAATILAVGGGLFVAHIATAHTPNPNVKCSGVTWDGTQYKPGDTATLTVNGVTQTDVVGADGLFHLEASFPGTGLSTWAYSVDSIDNQYDVSNSGTQLGCQGDTTTTEASTSTSTTTTSTPTTSTSTTTTLPTSTSVTSTTVLDTTSTSSSTTSTSAPGTSTSTSTTEPSTSSSVAQTTSTTLSSVPPTSPTTTTSSTSPTPPPSSSSPPVPEQPEPTPECVETVTPDGSTIRVIVHADGTVELCDGDLAATR